MAYSNISQAKQKLSAYVSAVESGKESEVIITRNGKAVAKIVPFQEEEPIRLGAGLLFMDPKPFVVKSEEYDDYAKQFGY